MTTSATDRLSADLVAEVDLLCLDAGNTVIFLDHARLATIVTEVTGAPCTAAALVRSEGDMKRLAESGELDDRPWAFRDRPGATNWGRAVGTIVLRAGADPSSIGSILETAWPRHVTRNLWDKVPEGLPAALDALRASGAKTAIISNSEGMLDELFAALGIRNRFDLVVDSGKVGVDKPDPRIFQIAFDRFGIPPARALHLGDVFATDIVGARAAGCRAALIDPYDHYVGRHPDVPRVPSAAAAARAITELRRRSGGAS